MNRSAWMYACQLGGAAVLAVLVWRLGSVPFIDGVRRITWWPRPDTAPTRSMSRPPGRTRNGWPAVPEPTSGPVSLERAWHNDLLVPDDDAPATRRGAPRSEGAMADHERALHAGFQNDAPTPTTVLIVSCVCTEQP
jgi:hypothetical protein